MTQDDDRKVDAALVRLATPTKTFAVPLMIALSALLAVSIAVVVLATVVAAGNSNQQHTAKVADCRNLFTADISDAMQDASRWGLTMQSDFNRTLLLVSQRKSDDIDAATLQRSIDAANRASVTWASALAARNAWVADGSPLPCPLD